MEGNFRERLLALRQEYSQANTPADLHDLPVVAEWAGWQNSGKSPWHAQVERPRCFAHMAFEVVHGDVFFAFAAGVPQHRQLHGAHGPWLRAIDHVPAGEPLSRLIMAAGRIQCQSNGAGIHDDWLSTVCQGALVCGC